LYFISKRKEIHVDKLIIKANEVIIIDENRRHRRDPWGFGRDEQISVDDVLNDVGIKDDVKLKEVDDEVTSEINVRDNEEVRTRLRWF
jgi:hypothetical protein